MLASPAAATPVPGMEVDGENSSCTAGFAAQGADGAYYLMTAGHCDTRDGTAWTGAADDPLGPITANEGARDAAVIRLDPAAGAPVGSVAGRYPVRDVLRADQIPAGALLCKVGARTGETCGPVVDVDAALVEARVFSLEGDSGSPGFLKNPDGTVSAVGLLVGSPEGDDHTSYFTLVDPLLAEWGLRILP